MPGLNSVFDQRRRHDAGLLAMTAPARRFQTALGWRITVSWLFCIFGLPQTGNRPAKPSYVML
jgi:hypothetical protein